MSPWLYTRTLGGACGPLRRGIHGETVFCVHRFTCIRSAGEDLITYVKRDAVVRAGLGLARRLAVREPMCSREIRILDDKASPEGSSNAVQEMHGLRHIWHCFLPLVGQFDTDDGYSARQGSGGCPGCPPRSLEH